MKNLKKVLVIAAAGAICLSNSSLATDALGTTSSFSGKKMLLLAIAVVATILVLYMSYKSDSPSELKPRTKAKKEDCNQSSTLFAIFLHFPFFSYLK